MYENIYTYWELINEKSIYLLFKPNFQKALTIFDEKYKLLSDGKIIIKNNSCNNYVYVSKNASWLLEDDGYGFILFVTEATCNISSPLGDAWNKEFNRMLQNAKKDYYNKKKKEIRLYFYDSDNDKLQICPMCTDYCSNKYAYDLRSFHLDSYCAIDKRYSKPDKSCFILGRIRKTIGLKNPKLLSFIEPVHTIDLDFEKDKWDFGNYTYNAKLEDLKNVLLSLLCFYISKKFDTLEVMRIRGYLKNYKLSPQEVILYLKNKIWENFKKGDVKELRKLDEVLKKEQDCTNVKFQLRFNGDIECVPNKNFIVTFENGELDLVTAKWVYDNIHNCTNAKGRYLGTLRNTYNFY